MNPRWKITPDLWREEKQDIKRQPVWGATNRSKTIPPPLSNFKEYIPFPRILVCAVGHTCAPQQIAKAKICRIRLSIIVLTWWSLLTWKSKVKTDQTELKLQKKNCERRRRILNVVAHYILLEPKNFSKRLYWKFNRNFLQCRKNRSLPFSTWLIGNASFM